MRKIILTAACATMLGLASIATASAQFATRANEGMTNTTTNMSTGTADTRMNAQNKMKKKKMKKPMASDGMSSGMDKGGMSKGGMEKKM